MRSGARTVVGALALVLLTGAAPDRPELRWVTVAGGCFAMGSDAYYAEEAPITERCLPGFEMLATEVTNAQFARFVAETGHVTDAERGWRMPAGNTPLPPGSSVFVPPTQQDRPSRNWWQFIEGASWRKPHGPDGPEAIAEQPVVHITHRDARAFADWAGGRLPTEAQWEFAARDTATAFKDLQANTWQGLFPVADSRKDGYASVAPVGAFQPNPQGLHDMLGNVWELTLTPFAPSHDAGAVAIAGQRGFDPAQPTAQVVVMKGGSYLCASDYCMRFRPAARQAQDAELSTSHIGFRLVRDAR
ncbi:MAG: SUMF1/EgtB/PvdO family nonheme iron enzyme [Pseudomonadota bacterium]